ncbi:MAG TPA: isoprenylcysteine carboxylmethyltransferase family protein [Bacteroidetes bacterium]|nr:isoprenylcysteine carboxylmethyltransferase family protein [Bacteroidota bacterium]
MTIVTITYFSLLFFLSEFALMIVKRSKKNGTKAKNDKKSLALFWVTIPLSLTIGFFTANRQEWNTLNHAIAIFGLSVLLIGIIIRWISIIQLNKEFTVNVAIIKNHTLKTDGMYRHLRHPSYLGLLLIGFGLSISMNSIISMMVVTIPMLAALIYRIKTEENILISQFGETYKDYMKKTYRIIPKIY